MVDLDKEIMAYALQNAIEFGNSKAGNVLPKLFQHGLEKNQISEVIPRIQEIVKEVNSFSSDERFKKFGDLKEVVKKRVEVEESLRDLPGIVKGKKPRFRLAPFPSGALHIGNAKTYVLNALYAEKYGGEIILVMDDTIGSAEKPLVKKSYKLIEHAFKWLEIEYDKIVYKSDRLKIYYKYAEELIKKNKAYVCYCEVQELRENRRNGIECGCRQFPIGIQKKRWEEMFKMKEGHGVLRIKTDMQDLNPAFRDRVLFKISDRAHVRVGKKYRVWPTLEMSWAIDDHLLGITHIIRGNDLAIETDMEKYIWDIFRWKHPEVIHTGLIRLDGIGAKISKSKAQKEVLSGEFTGWDDPRTWSIQSLKRRGIKKEAVRDFIEGIGLNRQDTTVPIETLYSLNRKLIDEKSNRYSFVENPKKINLKKKITVGEIEVPIHPNKGDLRLIKMGPSIFISSEDFKEYKDKEIRLSHLFNVRLGNESEITSIDNKKIQRLQWVSKGVPTKIFMPDGTWKTGLAEAETKNLKKGNIIQFERVGFVKFDSIKDGVLEFWFSHM